MMHRKFIAAILAISVGITGLAAAPARADGEDILKILGGVAAIAVIGAAIAKAKDDDDKVSRNYPYHNNRNKSGHHRHKRHKSTHHKHRHHHKHHSHRNGHRTHAHGYDQRHGYDRHDRKARPLPKRVQRKLLPSSCRVHARGRHGNFPAYGNWCLSQKFRYANALPHRCAVNARMVHNNKRGRVYSSRCLSRYGYTAARY